MSDTKSGLPTLLREIHPEDDDPPDNGEQLALGLDHAGETKEAREARFRGKPGRPAGARGKRTLAWADHILARYPSPLLGLAAMANMPTDQLAATLGCSMLEAFQEKRHAHVALLPYVHSRMPIDLNVQDRRVIELNIQTMQPGAIRPSDTGAITIATAVI